MPVYQGELDGLCGPYAIANAFELCGESPDQAFQVACSAIPRSRWPDVLWNGTTFFDIRRMIKKCLLITQQAPNGIKVKYPFLKNEPSTNAKYWEGFDQIFSDPSVICALVGLTKPSLHWSIVEKSGSRILFTDSTAGKLNFQKNRSSIHAGKRSRLPAHIVIDRKELVIFQR